MFKLKHEKAICVYVKKVNFEPVHSVIPKEFMLKPIYVCFVALLFKNWINASIQKINSLLYLRRWMHIAFMKLYIHICAVFKNLLWKMELLLVLHGQKSSIQLQTDLSSLPISEMSHGPYQKTAEMRDWIELLIIN